MINRIETEKPILIVTGQMEAMAPMSAVIATVLQQAPTIVSPSDAVRCAEATSFDLIIIDMQGGAEQFALVRHFRNRFNDIPMIAMVPYGDVNMVEQVLENGVDDYISQPIPLQRLKTTLRNALRMRSLLKYAGHHYLQDGHVDARPALVKPAGQLKTLREIEDEAIRHAIDSCNGCITRAARALGVGRSTLYRKIQEKVVEAA